AARRRLLGEGRALAGCLGGGFARAPSRRHGCNSVGESAVCKPLGHLSCFRRELASGQNVARRLVRRDLQQVGLQADALQGLGQKQVFAGNAERCDHPAWLDKHLVSRTGNLVGGGGVARSPADHPDLAGANLVDQVAERADLTLRERQRAQVKDHALDTRLCGDAAKLRGEGLDAQRWPPEEALPEGGRERGRLGRGRFDQEGDVCGWPPQPAPGRAEPPSHQAQEPYRIGNEHGQVAAGTGSRVRQRPISRLIPMIALRARSDQLRSVNRVTCSGVGPGTRPTATRSCCMLLAVRSSTSRAAMPPDASQNACSSDTSTYQRTRPRLRWSRPRRAVWKSTPPRMPVQSPWPIGVRMPRSSSVATRLVSDRPLIVNSALKA